MVTRRTVLKTTGALGVSTLAPRWLSPASAETGGVHKTTFVLDDVTPGTVRLPSLPAKQVIKTLLAKPNQPLESWSQSAPELVEVGSDARSIHPFLMAMNTAYDRHYPIVLSPDMIWLLILGGLASHVNANPEKLRDKFVAHQGKLLLNIDRDEFVRGNPNNDWEGAFAEFSEKIRTHTGPETHDLIVCGFSTTGAVERAAMEVALMDTLQSYFTYAVTTACGFPAITLEGTVEDWQLLRAKAEDLVQYDLDWWIPHLLPVLDQFIVASEGAPDKKFWCDFYKRQNPGSGAPRIHGHVNALFPYFGRKRPSRKSLLADYDLYLRDGPFKQMLEDQLAKMRSRFEEALDAGSSGLDKDTLKRNPYLGKAKLGPYEGFTTADISTTMNSAPFIWQYHETPLQMQFLAGFVGSTQNPESLAIRPTIGWAVREGIS